MKSDGQILFGNKKSALINQQYTLPFDSCSFSLNEDEDESQSQCVSLFKPEVEDKGLKSCTYNNIFMVI